MTTRTDLHRPSAIVPADYDFVAFNYLKIEDLGVALFLADERRKLRDHMDRTGGRFSGHEHGGNCHVCGSVNAIYTATFHHRASNTYIRTGLDCAEKLECEGIEAFRRNVGNALEATAGKRKAKAVLEREGLTAAWAIFEAGGQGRDASTLIDIVGRLVQYGSLSDGQIRFLRVLVDRVQNAPAIAAKRAAEAEAAAPVPASDKRILVRGTILTVRLPDENAPFPQTKILVQHADGWKVWGSRPASLQGVIKGDVVEFDALVSRSDRDTKFGFFSRPTKGRIIEEAVRPLTREQICTQVNAERKARFPVITEENLQEVDDWRAARLQELFNANGVAR